MRTSPLTAALLVLTTASPAIAQPPIVVEGSAPTARVSYSDLNLASPSGIERLQSRVRRTAESLCVEGAKTDLVRASAEHKCFTAAVASAQGQIDAAVRSSPTIASAMTIAVTGR
jgi:UrcA family protein